MSSQNSLSDTLIVLRLPDEFHEAVGVIPVALTFESLDRLDYVVFEFLQVLDTHASNLPS